MSRKDVSVDGFKAAPARIRDLETIDTELHLMAALRYAARNRGGPLPSIDVADALLDERIIAANLPLTHSLAGAHATPGV